MKSTYRKKCARIQRRARGRHEKEVSTHMFSGGVAGDLLKLAADHLRPRFRRFLALVPYTDHTRDYQRHQRNDTDQQRQSHDFATGRYYHCHFSSSFGLSPLPLAILLVHQHFANTESVNPNISTNSFQPV